jgi:hypothetical protein
MTWRAGGRPRRRARPCGDLRRRPDETAGAWGTVFGREPAREPSARGAGPPRRNRDGGGYGSRAPPSADVRVNAICIVLLARALKQDPCQPTRSRRRALYVPSAVLPARHLSCVCAVRRCTRLFVVLGDGESENEGARTKQEVR